MAEGDWPLSRGRSHRQMLLADETAPPFRYAFFYVSEAQGAFVVPWIQWEWPTIMNRLEVLVP